MRQVKRRSLTSNFVIEAMLGVFALLLLFDFFLHAKIKEPKNFLRPLNEVVRQHQELGYKIRLASGQLASTGLDHSYLQNYWSDLVLQSKKIEVSLAKISVPYTQLLWWVSFVHRIMIALLAILGIYLLGPIAAFIRRKPQAESAEGQPQRYFLLGSAQPHYDNSANEPKEPKDVNARIVEDFKTVRENLATIFLANISHEIRTPMGLISGYADCLLDPDQSFLQRQKCVQVIQKNVDVLVNTIDDILDLSRIDLGCLHIEKCKVSLIGLLLEIHSSLDGLAQKKNVSFSLVFDDWVPRYVFTDPLRLRQIIAKVVENAIKFTNEGNVKLTIRLVNLEEKSASTPLEVSKVFRCEFIVEDTGCGIPLQYREQLFKPFMQVDSSTTRQFGGTGLGLSLAQRLARALGGDLFLARSVPGEGSTFIISINPGDLSEIDFVYKHQLTEQHEAFVGDFISNEVLMGSHVLIVDDGLENRELFAYYLSKAGASVQTAANGREGVARALKENFDLVLMDIQMPQLDGYQALSLLRDQGLTIPVAALTAHAMKEERDRCLAAGFIEHISKPVTAPGLIKTVARLINVKSLADKPSKGDLAPQVSCDSPSFASAPVRLPPRLQQIVDGFVRDLPERIEAMCLACDQQDFAKLQRLAHKLKGAAGACGFKNLMDEVASIEDEIDSGLSPVSLRSRLEGLDRFVG